MTLGAFPLGAYPLGGAPANRCRRALFQKLSSELQEGEAVARRIELRTGCLIADGAVNGEVIFGWGEMMRTLLRRAPPGGYPFDQVVRAVEAMGPINRALAEAADSVVLTDEQWHFLRERLDAYLFGVADPAIVEFGLAIRDAPEIT